MKRVFLIVLDSVGIGAAPDAASFGDTGSDTWGSCARSGKLNTPNMDTLGINNIEGTSFFNPISVQEDGSGLVGTYGRLAEKSAGKDTTVGHWEMAGVISERPLPTYPEGFPQEILDALEEATGRKVICNKPYSGTEVIKDYGQEAEATGALIVYTSADSVMQIAANEAMIPPEELYDICRKARKIMTGDHSCGRIIARPYIGEYPNYTRTNNRHDFSLEPTGVTVLDAMTDAGLDTIGVGKIFDIFAGRGLTATTPNEGNHQNMVKTIDIAQGNIDCLKTIDEPTTTTGKCAAKAVSSDWSGICYVNLVDFDMIHGHRRDIPAYTEALNEFDRQLGELLPHLRGESEPGADDGDLLIITADHGCDPGYTGTDHTREYVPCLAYKIGDDRFNSRDIGTRPTFADIAATIADYFGLGYSCEGHSFL